MVENYWKGETKYVDKHDYNSEIREQTMNVEEKYVIPLLDKEWFTIILTIRSMSSANAKVMLEEMYAKIPLLFGFPKKKLQLNDFSDKVMMVNPDYIEAVDWINFHAGWVIDYKKSDFVAFHHPVRRLQDRFTLNMEYWR